MKISIITGSRADYGLLYWVIKRMNEDDFFDLSIIVTGMHLSEKYGSTYKEIENDNFKINYKVKMLSESDSPRDIAKSIAKGVDKFSDILEKIKPDFILILGDRYEIYSAAIAAMCLRTPIVHCHGGELTEGMIDESIRHSISKMSHIHFTSTEEYRKRVIQLGENPKSVINCGALGIENINNLKLYPKRELEKKIGVRLNSKNILVTYHPVTLEKGSSDKAFKELLICLNSIKDSTIVFTYSNSDIDGEVINSMIDEYVSHNSNSVAFISMGQKLYLSTLKNFDLIIGNSSSGIIEAPSFRIPTINIGDRQKGRIKSKSVISCMPNQKEINQSIKTAFSEKFIKKIEKIKNPYDNGNSSQTIINKIKRIKISGILKKEFYNLTTI
jgi:GDP/UDP-N,N'-diacetylbacillosamine 2-epimerase (hydrolysing)